MNNRPATVYFADRAIALNDLQERGARAAQALADDGLGAGDVVAILLRNEPAFVEAQTCVRCLDATLVLIPWHLTAGEIRPILAAVRPSLLIVHADLVARVLDTAALLPEMHLAVVDTPPELVPIDGTPSHPELLRGARLSRWEELITTASGPLPIPSRTLQAITLTSGSTGAPKIIRWEGQQRWIEWADRRTQGRPPIRSSIVTAPLYHGAQYGVFSQACHRQADQVILPRFDAEAFLSAVERYRINHAYLVPAMFVRLLKLPPAVRSRYDVSSLDHILQTGAPCAADIKHRMIDWLGPIIWEAYGTSETSTIASCSSHEWLAKPTSAGKPVRRVLIVDEQGRPSPTGQPGQIWVEVSDMPKSRYQNAEVVRRAVNGAEFIATGDVGSVDADGCLSVSGRVDDLINTGRLKVYPEEIENVILGHPNVRDCVVFGMPDAEFGQGIGAAVELATTGSDSERELRDYLRGRISTFKIPVVIWQCPNGLRSETGKVNRALLARTLTGAVGTGCHQSLRSKRAMPTDPAQGRISDA